LEKLVAIEEDVTEEPARGGSKDASTEERAAESERLRVVASNMLLPLLYLQLPACRPHFISAIEDEPEGAEGRNEKGRSISPLDGPLGVWRLPITMGNAKNDHKKDDVNELAPSLHKEGGGDFATAVEAILSSGHMTSANSALHSRGGSHRILAADADPVEEEGPAVADDPAVLGHSPCSREHQKTDKHDHCVLDEAPSSAEPVTNDADGDLTDNDTGNFEVIDCCYPSFVADLKGAPARFESRLQERRNVSNGEEDITERRSHQSA